MSGKSWEQVREIYNHFTLHVCPGPRSLSYFVPVVALPLTLLVPPDAVSFTCVRLLVLPFMYALQLQVWLRHSSFDVISMNHALMLFMLLGWYDVKKNFKHVRRLNKAKPQSSHIQRHEKQTTTTTTTPFVLEPYPGALSSRLRWVFHLLASLRLTDWQVGLPSHDARQPSSIHPFTPFFIDTTTDSIFLYVLLYSTYHYVSSSQTFVPSTLPPRLPPILEALIALTHLYASIRLLTSSLPTLLAVIPLLFYPHLRTHAFLSPLTWPSHFGPASVISTLPPPRTPHISPTKHASTSSQRPAPGLRAFWSQFWHQNMRHLTSTPGLALCHLFHLHTPSLRRYMVIVTTSFLLSGIVHMGVVPPLPLYTSWTVTQLRVRLAAFFWMQPVGIAVESGVQRWAGRRVQEQATMARWLMGWRRLVLQVGIMVWTVGFLAWSAWFTLVPVGREMRWWGLGRALFWYG